MGENDDIGIWMIVDVDALRSYLLDLCGTAMNSGLGAALIDVAEVESASEQEVLSIALRLGVDPAGFGVISEGA